MIFESRYTLYSTTNRNNRLVPVRDVHGVDYLAIKIGRDEMTEFLEGGEGEVYDCIMRRPHRNILPVVDKCESVEGDGYLIFPRVSTDLAQYIDEHTRVGEGAARNIITDLLNALVHLHSMNIVLNKIRLGKLVIYREAGNVRLGIGDFLDSKKCGTDGMIRNTGITSYYSSREMLAGVYDGYKSDIWGVGVVMYKILHGYFPFKSAENVIYDGTTYSGELSVECVDLLRMLLTKDVDIRPTAKNALKHRWLTSKRRENW